MSYIHVCVFVSLLTEALPLQEVTPDQFAEYMSYHNNKLFKPEFAPKPMSYAIRRTAAHSPQGVITIESKPDKGDAIAQPISTLVHSSQATGYMTVKLSASTQLRFGGDRFVHGATARINLWLI